MKKKRFPSFAIGTMAALFNISWVGSYGQMADTQYIFLLVANIIFMICNIVYTVIIFKNQDENNK